MKQAQLIYGPMGRLFETSGAAGANLTRLVHDGDELAAEYNSAGTMTRRYVHSDYVDDPVVQYDGAAVGASARTFLMPDERGSIAGLFYNDGTLRAINSYDEYGIPGASNQGRFQYTGQAWLPELGMYYYKARIYSPTLGRFLQTDPIGYDDQINLYAYVGNDPMNATDPDGKAAVFGFVVGFAGDVAFQMIVEGKSLDEVDKTDALLSGLAGASGVGAAKVIDKFFRYQTHAVRAQRVTEKARAASRAGSRIGGTRKQRMAAQAQNARAAVGSAKKDIEKAVVATGAFEAGKKAINTPPKENLPGKEMAAAKEPAVCNEKDGCK